MSPRQLPPSRRAAAPLAAPRGLATASAALALALALAPVQGASAQQPAAQPAVRTAAQPAVPVAAPAGFAELASAHLPAVVTITATAASASAGPESPGPRGAPAEPPFRFPPGSPFEDFFRDFFERGGPGGPGFGGPGVPGAPGAPGAEARPRVGLGSGFVIDPAGYIVTNNHVVEGAEGIEVTLQDDRKFDAEVVGTDPQTDLALLKIDAGAPLPSLRWGDSDATRVGDWVLAIGNPFGLGGTVTAGIVSARARDIGAGPYDDFLQTDAAINSGNSGGPLIATDGRVVGVNTAIYSRNGGNVGIGFAVPAAIARPVIAELRERGSVTRGWLGVGIQPITPDIAAALGVDARSGALVSSVSPGSPAAAAGVRAGDVVVGFGGEPIEGPRELSRAVAAAEVGKDARLAVTRDGRRLDLDVRIARLEPEPERVAAAAGGSAERGSLGLSLGAITPEARRRFDLPEDATGAVVVGVAPGSPAAERGFRPGDVIASANGRAVDDPEDVRSAIEQARRDDRSSVLVLRRRDEGGLFVPLPLDDATG